MVPRIVSQLFGRHSKVSDTRRKKGAESGKGAESETVPSLPTKEEPIHDQQLNAMGLSWEAYYLGSFPISNVTEEEVLYRIKKLNLGIKSPRVRISVSTNNIRVMENQRLLLNHPPRRILRVLERKETSQLAYVATEPSGSLYRRQCHLFKLDDPHMVTEIGSVIESARNSSMQQVYPHGMTSSTALTPQRHSMMPLLSDPSTTPFCPEKRSSSTAFLSRLLGSTPKPRESDSSDDAISDPKAKRRRRPVSAVFSQALHRLSSTTNMAQKRMSTIEIARAPEDNSYAGGMRHLDDLVHRRINPPLIEEESVKKETSLPPEPELVFDEKINAWYYPVDTALEQQLSKVHYFVRNPSRELVTRQLFAHGPGAFIVRSSDKRRKCLALSMRVPPDANPNGLVHYLIIRDDKGYRLKGATRSFPSIQSLCTHYSVLKEHLPCPLVFVQWKEDDWTSVVKRPKTSSIQSNCCYDSYKSHSARSKPLMVDFFVETDENWNSIPVFSHRHSVHSEYRNSRMDYRHSRIIDPDQPPYPLQLQTSN